VFGYNGHGKVRGVGTVRILDHFTLREVACVEKLSFNLLSVSQLLKDGFEVIFQEGSSRVLDSQGDLVCQILPCNQVFPIDFSGTFSGPSRCLVLVPLLSFGNDIGDWVI